MLSPADFQSPVAFFLNGFGDTILALPALRALSHLFDQRLTLICEEGAYELCYSELPLRDIVPVALELPRAERLFDARFIADKIDKCDLFLSLVPWSSKSSWSLKDSLAPSFSIGFFPNFDITLARDYSKHSADLLFDLPRLFDRSLVLEDFAAPPYFPPEAQTYAQELFASIPSWVRILTVHTDTSPEKMWLLDRLVTVLDGFMQKHSDFIAMDVSLSGAGLDNGRYGRRVIPSYGLSLDISMCLVAQADLFLGIDSCMLHVADFNRVPGVGLFGPTNCLEFGFRLGPHRHVCANGSMDLIPVEAVLDALEALFAESHGLTTGTSKRLGAKESGNNVSKSACGNGSAAS